MNGRRTSSQSQGFVQSNDQQPFVAQSSELGNVVARCLAVGVKQQPNGATGALVYEFRGTAKYGSYLRYFGVAGPQTVLLDLTPFNDWALKLVGAGGTTLPPDISLAWASTLAEPPDPARRERAYLAVSYAALVSMPIPPGAVRCWSAAGAPIVVTWYAFTVAGLPIPLADTVTPAVEVTPKGTHLTPASAINLLWEIAL